MSVVDIWLQQLTYYSLIISSKLGGVEFSLYLESFLNCPLLQPPLILRAPLVLNFSTPK